MGGNGGSSCLGTLCCLLILGGIGGSLAWYFTKGGGTVPKSLQDALNFIPTLDDFHKEAPFEEQHPNEVPRWPHDGYGLTLGIENALEDLWTTYFDQAVSDWNNGDPDVLTLTSSVVTTDPSCTPVDGVIKVCNNDFGDTGWYGINEISSIGKEIVSSIAKMNDYYFSDDGSDMADRRQYTMCHEMGHGFGLPHTDESFTNTDQGNCLDYTNHPENNLHPSSVNYEFLNALYGDGNGTTTIAPSSGATDDAVGTAAPSSGGGTGGRQRALLQLPDWVQAEWRQVSAAATIRGDVPSHWRKLYDSRHGDIHQVDLGENYSIRVERLRPVWLD